MLRTDSDPELLVFDPVIRILHWLTLFLVATIFVLAFSIDFASSREEAVALTQLHRSFGVTVWVVTLGRLVWRQFARFPNWPADMPQAMRFAAQWSEYSLYAFMLTQPILGLLWTNAYGDRVNLFFLEHFPFRLRRIRRGRDSGRTRRPGSRPRGGRWPPTRTEWFARRPDAAAPSAWRRASRSG